MGKSVLVTTTAPAPTGPTEQAVSQLRGLRTVIPQGHRPSARQWVILCGALAAAPMIEVHMVGAGKVDPIVQPISHYAYVPTGYWMILLGSILLALSASAISWAMLRTGDQRLRMPAMLLVSFVVAIMIVGIFPTDLPGTIDLSLSAQAHRWSAAWAFLILPIVGLLACRSEAVLPQFKVSLLRLSMVVCIATGIVFAIHLPLAVVGSHIPMFGAIERFGFLVMVAYMVVLSGTMKKPLAVAVRQ